MTRDWLWDKKISLREARNILSDPEHPKFIYLAALLLSRKNSPREVLKEYISPRDFCLNWLKIKKQMSKDAWNSPRIHFWQAIYEKVREKLGKRGIKTKVETKIDGFCLEIGQALKKIRRDNNLTQKELAKKLNVSQQLVSRIEIGRENLSLRTLKEFAWKLGKKLAIEFKPIPP